MNVNAWAGQLTVRLAIVAGILTPISGLVTYAVLSENRAEKPWFEALKSSPVYLGYVGAILNSLYLLQFQAN